MDPVQESRPGSGEAGGGETGRELEALTVVAIDGPAGSGKSTVARRLAEALDLGYLDTGAMYRSVTHAVMIKGLDPEDGEAVAELARATTIELDPDGTVLVDGADVTHSIRSPGVSRAVSTVAAHPEVRAELVERQRQWAAAHGGGVLEGRDIGTVVFPSAVLKVYLTASAAARAARRAVDEETEDRAGVEAELERRDRLDSGRASDPLRQADDAFVLDTTDLTIDEVVERLVVEVRARTTPTGGSAPAPSKARASAPPVGAESEEVSLALEGAARTTYRVIRSLLRLVARVFFRFEVVGREHLPTTGGFVLAPGGHRSILDTPAVSLAGPRVLRYMGAETYFNTPALGWFLRAMGGFPVERAATDRAALRLAEWVLENGEPLAVFPESTRQEGPIIQPLKEGASFLACRTGVPIVPVGIGGAERAMPKGARLFRPRKVVLVIGEPILPIQRVEGQRVKRSDIRKLTEQLSTELQLLFDEAQIRAGA